MSKEKIVFAVVLSFISLCAPFSVWGEPPATVQKRLVLFGYEFFRCCNNKERSAAQVFCESSRCLRDVGIDGVGLYLGQKMLPDGRRMISPMDDDFVWKYEDLAPDVPFYKEGFRKCGLKYNFLSTFFRAPKKHIAWNDDEAWDRIAETMRNIARFAKASGFRGLCADHEDYHHASQFTRRTDEPSWDELVPVVRARGRQVFSAVFAEFPDAELFFYWFLGWRDRFFTCRDVESALRDNDELWPAFANGILDALPPTARIVDGDEWAYYHEEPEYFTRSHNFRTVACQGMVASENRAKYRAQVGMGFGLYTDMYILPEKDSKGETPKFYRGPDADGSRLRKFAKTMAAATDASDEYVWIWNEAVQWARWSPPPKKYQYANTCLEEFLPGIRAVCEAARGAEGFVGRRERELAAKGALTNLIANASCDPANRSLSAGLHLDHKGSFVPKPWFAWHSAVSSNGVAGVDVGGGHGGGSALAVRGSHDGCFVWNLKNARPGDYYAFRVRVKGPAIVSVFPKKGGKDLTWWDEMGKIYCVPQGRPEADGWKLAQALVRIPDGVDEMSFHLGWKQEPDEVTRFDDVVLEPLVWFDPKTERTRFYK